MSATALPIYQHTQEWLDARLNGIGSSEAAAALGLSRWESKSRLWALKLRLIPDREPTLPMLVGTELEPLNARLYEQATGTSVRRVRRLLRHQRYPWMLASLDRRAGRKIVELKYTGRATDYGEPGTDEVPDEVLVQVLHQLIVTELPAADVSVLIGGHEHRIYHVELDPVAAEETIEREHDFWRSVESRTEPAIDGSEASRDYLDARYPRGNGSLIVADAEGRELLARLRALKVNEKQLAATLLGVTNGLRAVIGENDGLVAPGLGSLTWHRWPGAETTAEITDWQAVAAAYRALALEFTVVPMQEAVEKLDAIASIHTNQITTVTKKAGQKLGPAVWEQEEDATDAA